MGNHEIPCDYCGNDTRGLCGVRGCATQAEAEKCSSFRPPNKEATRRAPGQEHRMHDWIPSTLGHGETMCRWCRVTNREAAVIGTLNECSADRAR